MQVFNQQTQFNHYFSKTGSRAGKLLVLSAILASVSSQAMAQVVLDEIIVTAQKREQSAQDVPVSFSVFSEDALDKLDMTGVFDFAQRTPGLEFGNYTDLKLAPTSIRGVTAGTGSAGADPAVGYYLDEVYLGPGVGATLDLFDIQRVEVLRGPQGTLFGRNSIGGAISVVSNRPDDHLTGYVEAEYGNYNHVRIKGRLSGPIVQDKFNMSISGLFHNRDGYTENRFLGIDGDDTDRQGGSLSLDFFPSESVSVEINADYIDIKQNSKNYEHFRINPAGVVGAFLPAPGLPANTDPEDRVIFSNLESRETLESYGFSGKINIDMGAVELVSVTGFREHHYFNIGDTDVSPLDIGFDGDPEDVKRFSQELRLVSNSEGATNWIAGVYYLNQSTDNQSFIELGRDLSIIFTGDPDALAGVQAGSSAQMELDSYAVFGNVSHAFSDGFEVSIGGRYTKEDKEIAYMQDDPLGLLGGTIPLLEAKDSWSAFTPYATAKYSWETDDTDAMVYATISRGFKSGGFNDALGSADGLSFDPEFIWNYEIGLKSNWYDNRLVVNLAAFYLDWSDMQVTADNPETPAAFDPITTNVGSARSKGVEIEFIGKVTENFQVNGFASIMDASFVDSFLLTAPGAPVVKLEKIQGTPSSKFGAGAEYTYPISDDYELLIRGDFVRRGSSQLSPDPTDDDAKVGAYTLVNARISLTNTSGGWQIAAWGKNLTNTVYRTRMFNLFDNPFVGVKFSNLGPPRTYGVEARIDF